MQATILTTPEAARWSGWQKVSFRFFFIYFLLFIDPIQQVPSILGWKYVQGVYENVLDWAIDLADRYLFHIHPPGVPVPVNDGAGDTSQHWAQFWLYVLLAAVGCLIWSLADKRRKSYNWLGYWLRLGVRYIIALMCLAYGILKLFGLQMSAPNLSQLATPLGDFGAMRLCWMYMGYSQPYEIFAGVAEIVAGLLLLYRRTVTLGLLTGAGIFINVMTLNLSYDIPVKLFAMQLAFSCLFLLAWDSRRLVTFLVLNEPAGRTSLYDPVDSGRRIRIARLLLKLYFVYVAIVPEFISDSNSYQRLHKPDLASPIRHGVYAVRVFAVNGDTIPASHADASQWKDVIFDTKGGGSVGCPDTSFTRKFGYGRGLFHYETDSVKQLLTMTRVFSDKRLIMECRYDLPDSNTVVLHGRLRQDSLYIVLQRTDRQFQLSQWQFHWISESNR